MTLSLFELKNLSFSYEAALILKDVSLTISQGEFIGIIGPNGGGKTTLLNLLMGFLSPSQGSLFIEGKPPKFWREKIGFVPQSLQFDRLFPITVLEVVLMGTLSKQSFFGRYSQEAIRSAEEALKKLDLLPYKDKLFGTLSGGQIQRTLIARALVRNPEILILDEPTASVDKESQEAIYALLRRLKGTITILMVTHQLQSILADVDRILCVQTSLLSIPREEVCKHYALGVYHPHEGERHDR